MQSSKQIIIYFFVLIITTKPLSSEPMKMLEIWYL